MTTESNPRIPLGIYIQVPFCQAKCTYCNFHTGVYSASLDAPYVDALCREIRHHEALYSQAGIESVCPCPVVDTLYIGGGTPSLLDPAEVARLTATVRESFPCDLRELTLEADPETITFVKATAWRAAGFNRISLGVQSFDDRELKASGRRHRREDIFHAVRLLREAGFDNLSFDLIAGLPCQSPQSWAHSVSEAITLQPEHVSIYMLEIDEGSRLGRAVLAGTSKYSAGAVPSDDHVAAFYEYACTALAAGGYRHYEISNWARCADWRPGHARQPSFRSRHNLKYWRRQPYLGFGAGAHSFNGRQRWANAHDPAAYVAALRENRLPAEQFEEVTRQQALEEEIFLGLRQLEGIDLLSLEAEYNVSFENAVARLEASQMLEREGGRVRLSPGALTIANHVILELLEAAIPASVGA